MPKLQDQFDMGRIPLRPLPYENKEIAFTHELMVDTTGENPTYHIFITSTEDPTKVIDLSAAIILEGFNSKDLTVSIAGVKEPISIQKLIEYIYLRFVHVDDIAGFNPAEDLSKVMDSDNKNVILKDINGNAVFPVVRAETIYDSNGVDLDSKLKSISHLAVLRDVVFTTTSGQNTFDITYPFNNYLSNGNYMELRVGGTYISPDKYVLTENVNEAGQAFGCTVTFPCDVFEIDRKIEIVYFYNSISAEGVATTIDGSQIANKSIPVTKFKTSNSYTYDDPDTIATSRALYRLYDNMGNALAASGSKMVFAKDLSNSDPNTIIINLANEDLTLGVNYIMVSVYLTTPKRENTNIVVHYMNGTTIETKNYDYIIPNGIAAGKMLKLLINKDECHNLTTTETRLIRNRYFHYSQTPEDEISFSGLEYDSNSLLFVYRNGVRLFEDLDFTINHQTQIIKLFTKTAAKDVIVFEAESLAL